MGRLSHYPWFVDDFLSSPWVMSCTLKQEAIYRRLLDLQWKSTGCQIPDNIKAIRGFVKKANDRVSEDEIVSVLNANFELIVLSADNRMWRNHVLYYHFNRMMLKSEKARESVNHRKVRPIAQTSDSPTTGGVAHASGQSNANLPYPYPEPKPKEDVKKNVLPETVSQKIMAIATEKANLAWIAFEATVMPWANLGARLAIEDTRSRAIFNKLGAKEIEKLALAQNDLLKETFIREYRQIEITEFALKKNQT